MRTRMIGLAATTAVGLALAGCSGAGPDDSSPAGPTTSAVSAPQQPSAPSRPTGPEEFRGADRAAFYTPPASLARAQHGRLLRYERAHFAVQGGIAWKVLYASTSLTGKPIAVSGVVIVPTGKAPTGGWKMVSVAHGTTGVADSCAPSRADLDGNPMDASYPVGITTRDVYDTLPAAAGYLKAGYVLAITDYEGLGTPGIHPYMVGESEGRSVVDAARAARQLPGVPVQKKYAIWGYSQGGHAAAWANDVAASWAPELHLVGSVAGAPLSELNLVAKVLSEGSREPSIFFMMVAGYAAAYPELKPAELLTPAGMQVLALADKGCDAMTKAVKGTSMKALVRPGFDQNKPWGLALGKNNPGRPERPKVTSPLLVLHSAEDQFVPAFLSDVMFQRMCGLGQVVERRIYPHAGSHFEAAAPAGRDGLPWIQARMAGKRATSTCPQNG